MLDVAIIGRGAAGLACAQLLARRGRGVAVFGSAAGVKTIEAAPPATAHAMASCGLNLAELPAARPSTGTLSLWGDDVPRAVDYLFQAPGTGWEIDRAMLDAELATAAETAGVCLDERRVNRVRRTRDGWMLALTPSSPTQELHAKFVILANGRTGSTFGFTRRRCADALVAVSFLAEHAASESRAWIEAQPDGWWYSVPGGHDDRTVALFTDAVLLPARRPTLHDWCLVRLAQSQLTSKRIRRLAAESAHVVSASSRRLESPAGKRWAAIGDAAAAFDPISSAGLRFAFESARRVADLLSAGWNALEFSAWHEFLWSRYTMGLRAIYSRERRWLDAPFWRKRLVAGNDTLTVRR